MELLQKDMELLQKDREKDKELLQKDREKDKELLQKDREKDMELVQKDRELLEKDLAHEKDLREVGERYLQLYVKEEVKDHVLAFLAEGEYELLRQVKADRVEKHGKSVASPGVKPGAQ
jgi:tRNA G18 (ribose-2'-O)-methylase SpoU